MQAPYNFTLSGFSNAGNNGVYVQLGPLLNGHPMYINEGNPNKCCCYVESSHKWLLQPYESRGTNCGTAQRLECKPWEPGNWIELCVHQAGQDLWRARVPTVSGVHNVMPEVRGAVHLGRLEPIPEPRLKPISIPVYI